MTAPFILFFQKVLTVLLFVLFVSVLSIFLPYCTIAIYENNVNN